MRWPRCQDPSASAALKCVLREGHAGPHLVSDDPDDSPLVRQVLYTNDVSALLSAVIGGLMFRAHPERIKKALEGILADWDQHVAQAQQVTEFAERKSGEPSGWEDDRDPPD